MWFGVGNFVFFASVSAFRIDDQIPRLRVVEPVRSNPRWDIVVIQFANPRGEPSVLPKQLRQGYGVRRFVAEMTIEIVHTNRVRPKTRQKRCAAGIAKWQLTIRSIKLHAASCQSVDVWRLRDRVSVTTKGVGKVIDGDK